MENTTNESNGPADSATWQTYRRTARAEMRLYVPGECLDKIGVGTGITPAQGGMVARDPSNHNDMWYIAEDYLIRNFEVV